jgi:hypothetical protein
MPTNRLGLVCFVLLIATRSATGSTGMSIQSKIVRGGEVSITEVRATRKGQSVTVSGDGVEVFPNRTCGYPEIEFEDSSGRTLLREYTPYEVYHVYAQFSRPALAELSRSVTFSVAVPISASVALVVVRHHSIGGCDNNSSLKYAFDWLLSRFFPPHKHVAANGLTSRNR